MVKSLVKFYNTIIKFNHCPSRRFKVVDIVIEKVKGNITNKFKLMQIIQAYLQLFIRVFLGLRVVNE